MEIKKIQNQKFKIQNYQLETKDAQLIRYLSEMKDVLYDQKWAKNAPDFQVYYVWRGLKPGQSPFRNLREENDIRYDITIIPAKMLGQEFPKTKGHRHLNHFQELIQVLEGRAFYFAQRGQGKKIEDCYVIKAKKGNFVIIPPNVDHLTINPGGKKLVMANWIFKKVKSDYSLFEKFQGACYYYTKSGWIKNKNYDKIPNLRFEKPLKSKPKNLDFLK